MGLPYGENFIISRFWDIGSLKAENRQFCLPWPWNPGQGSLKAIDFGTNAKRVYTFLLVINSNFSPILHRFGDGGLKFEDRQFYLPSIIERHRFVGTLRISGWNLQSKN